MNKGEKGIASLSIGCGIVFRMEEAGGRIVSSKFEKGCDSIEPETGVLAEAVRQVKEYLRGERREFNLEIEPEGTDFQLAVWGELRKTRFGETVTYGEVARRIGRPGAARAVGNAVHRNPLHLFVACHRVVPTNGGLGGFAAPREVKQMLLDIEKRSAPQN